MKRGAMDSMAEAMQAMNDPAVMAEAVKMMKDPKFAQEIQAYMKDPQMKKYMDAVSKCSSYFVYSYVNNNLPC
jgi:hypothetical protein